MEAETSDLKFSFHSVQSTHHYSAWRGIVKIFGEIIQDLG